MYKFGRSFVGGKQFCLTGGCLEGKGKGLGVCEWNASLDELKACVNCRGRLRGGCRAVAQGLQKHLCVMKR